MPLHLSNLASVEHVEIHALAIQISHYLNDLMIKLTQYSHEINEAQHYLPSLEACDIQHLSTVLRTWYRVIKKSATTSRFDAPSTCQC